MTIRKPVSAKKNVWFDSQQVSQEDLSTEQQYNDQITSSFLNNQVGTGAVTSQLVPKILFDSDVAKLSVGNLDGKPVPPTDQPSDGIEGVQLELELTESLAAGRKTVKVAVIGLDFNGDLQYDTFYFAKNEKQTTARHYTRILSVLFNDFLGINSRSFNLGGRLVIREASSFTLSRDTIMVSQSVEPNLFFRDFYLDGAYATLSSMLQVAVQGYNVDNLGISTSYKQLRKLLVNDVTTQIGQKFKATTNNIQKITLLLGVENTVTPTDLSWNGDLTVSIYSLQSTVSSSSEIVPTLAIDYSPSNIPLAQVSINYNSLLANGTILDGYLQPVDFVFSNTPVANGTLKLDNYYIVTLKRSGSADKCNILTPVSSDRVDDSRVSIFNGTVWVDIEEEDLWFKVWTDSAKVTDGQAYDAGQGVVLTKTKKDKTTGATVDNVLNKISFSSTTQYTAVLKAVTETSDEVQDQRTGNPVDSRQQLIPSVSLVGQSEVTRLQESGEPLLIGTIQDKNIKSFDAINNSITSSQYHFGLFKNKLVVKLNETNNDVKNNLNILTSLLNGDFVEAKFIPNNSVPSIYYRIAAAEVLTMKYGDVDGNGIVDLADADLATKLLNQTLTTAPSLNEYISSTSFFTSAATVTLTLKLGNVTVLSTSGNVTVDLVDGTVATFTDGYTDFANIPNVLSCDVVLSGSTTNNNGTYDVISVPSGQVIQFKKFYRDVDAILKILRADINSDGYVGNGDVTLINNFVAGIQPIPAISSPANKIGTEFRAILFTLEKYTDRNDDYPNNTNTRATDIHVDPDVFISDGSFVGWDYSTPVPYSVTKRFVWKDDLVVASSNVKIVPSVFSDPVLQPLPEPIEGVQHQQYPVIQQFNPGRNDLLVPANLVLGRQIVTPTGEPFKVDFEIGSIVLTVPVKDFPDEKTINLFTDFVADYNDNGTTRLGYPAMKFADGSFVMNPKGLELNQVRFTASIQSFFPELDGLTSDGYEGIIIDDKMGVQLDAITGVLKLNFSHLKEDLLKKTLSTKVQITVYLKKAGFNNNSIVIDSAKLANIFQLN